MTDSLARWRLTALVAAGLVVSSCPLHLAREALRRPAPKSAVTAEAAFVGRKECARCHEKEAKAWTGSHHDQAMTEATEETVRGDFSGVVFEGDGMKARFFREGGKFRIETDGPDGKPTVYEVAYTFGWNPLQQYLVRFPGGRMQAFSVAWNVPAKRWFFLYPGKRIPPSDWLHWTRNAQNWNGMCAECHSTNLVKGFDPESNTYATTWSEVDVSCEACHGPSSEHLVWAALPEGSGPADVNTGLIVQTRDLTNEELLNVCARCHSRRAILGDYTDDNSDLLNYMIPMLTAQPLYHVDGQILDEVYEYGSFTQSRMFEQDVMCSDCHDSHSARTIEPDNRLCLQCH